MTYSPAMVQAQVLYANAFRISGSVTTYDGTVVPGFDAANAYDWRDFSLFRQSSGSHITVHLPYAITVDAVCLWSATVGPTATVEYSNDGTTWIALCSTSATGHPQWLDPTPTSATWLRVWVSAQTDWRQITIGVRLQFPIGQWSDVNPPTLIQGVVVESKISVNGSIIGRNQRRFEKSGKISLDYLQPDWVRGAWDTFVQHAVRYPFWYRWDPVGHSDEVAFAAADDIVAPRNAKPQPLMHAEMPIVFIT